MTKLLKWLAFYLLFIPAMFIGMAGAHIIPDRKDVHKMSLTKAVTTVVIIGSILAVFAWAVWQYFA